MTPPATSPETACSDPGELTALVPANKGAPAAPPVPSVRQGFGDAGFTPGPLVIAAQQVSAEENKVGILCFY